MANGKDREEQEAELAAARVIGYRLLARCFTYPDRGLIELFEAPGLDELVETWRYHDLDLSTEIDGVITWLRRWPSHETALLELEKDYTRLFVSAHPGVVAPPYSSVYLDGSGQVWGASTAEVVNCYRAAGLDIADEFNDIPDHIAAELEFVSYLIGEQQKDDEGVAAPDSELDEIERQFLDGHLFKWAPAFFGRVAEHAETTFYRRAASIARQFVAWDARHAERPTSAV